MTSTERTVARRTLTRSVAWATPAVVLAAPVAAYAASPTAACCYTMSWGTTRKSTLSPGSTFTASSSQDACGSVAPRPAASCAAQSISVLTTPTGQPGGVTTAQTCSTGLYSSTYHGKVGYQAEYVNYPANDPFVILGPTASSPGLVLNIGTGTNTTVRFTFPAAVTCATLLIWDVSRIVDSARPPYEYTDEVTLDKPWTMSGNLGSANRTSGAAGVYFSRTAQFYADNSTGPIVNYMSTTSTTSFTTLTLTYRAADPCGWQFIALGPMSYCLA